MRKIRICFWDKSNGPIMKAAKQVITTLYDCEVMQEQNPADLIFALNTRDIADSFDSNKVYIIIAFPQRQKCEHDNVHVFSNLPEINNWFPIINMAIEKLTEDDIDKSQEEVELLPDAKKILVIDDSKINQQSAKKLLAGHHLTIATGYNMAMKLLSEEKFDIVLTDLYLPMSPKTLSDNAFELGKLIPYGFIIRDEAAHRGAKYVAIATDIDHHSDPLSAAFDYFSGFPIQIEGAKTIMIHASSGEDGKNWSMIMEKLLIK